MYECYLFQPLPGQIAAGIPKYLTLTVGNIGRFEEKLRREEDALGIAQHDRVSKYIGESAM